MICYGTSQSGTEHERLGRECQDSFLSGKAGRYTITVIADGLGSAARSKEGSSTACEFLINSLTELLSGDSCDTVKAMKLAFCIACTAVLAKARSEGMQPSVFDTTLSAVIADENSITYGHVGDGGIARLTPDGSLRLITSRQSGFYEGSVHPLVGSFENSVFERKEGSWNVIMLATDGILNFLTSLSQGEERQRYISAFFKGAFDGSSGKRQLENYLLRAMKDEQLLRKVDDDRTLAFTVNETVPLPAEMNIDFSDRKDAAVTHIRDEYEGEEFAGLCSQFGLDSSLLPQHLEKMHKAADTDDAPVFEIPPLPPGNYSPASSKSSGNGTAIVLSVCAIALILCVALFFILFFRKPQEAVSPSDVIQSDTVSQEYACASDEVSDSDTASTDSSSDSTAKSNNAMRG